MATKKTDWILTGEALNSLLAQLDPDRERAAEKYEEIRQRLMKLFKWRGCLQYEEYADQTIDRVARKLAEGAEFQTPNPYTLFYAVANNLLKEHWRKSQRESELRDDLILSQGPIDDPEDLRTVNEEKEQHEARIACLRRCVGQLAPESLLLIQKYYAEGEVLNKEQRKQIAGELRISVNALRVRAFRIRTDVEQCVGSCLNTAGFR